jgi:hypothetical protein
VDGTLSAAQAVILKLLKRLVIEDGNRRVHHEKAISLDTCSVPIKHRDLNGFEWI